MNHSILTADRNTHLKMVTVALVAAIVLVVIGFSARVNNFGTATAQGESNGLVVKAGKLTQITTRDGSVAR